MELMERLSWTEAEEDKPWWIETEKEDKEVVREIAINQAEECFKKIHEAYRKDVLPWIKEKTGDQAHLAYCHLKRTGDLVSQDTVEDVADGIVEEKIIIPRIAECCIAEMKYEETLQEFAEAVYEERENVGATKDFLEDIVLPLEGGWEGFKRKTLFHVDAGREESEKLYDATQKLVKAHNNLTETSTVSLYSLIDAVPKMSKEGLEGLQTIMDQEIYKE